MKKKPLPWHTLLVAIYPPLFLFSQNVERLELLELAIPIPLIAILAALSLGVLYLILRDLPKAALVATPTWLLFWYYTDIYWFIEPWTIGDFRIGRQRYLAAVLAVLLAGVLVLVWRSKKKHENLTRIMNVVSACLVLMAAGTVVSYRVTHARANTATVSTSDMTAFEGPLPDVYYVILDGYGRQDILADLMDFDNSAFVEGLRERGFYVADKACSNYCQTQLSLASSLNLDYVQALPVDLDPCTDDRLPLTALFRGDKVFAFFRREGYSLVSFATGFNPTELRQADIYVTGHSDLTNFQTMLLGQTPLQLMKRFLVAQQFDHHRSRIIQAMDLLGDAEIAPKFVFAHLISPHPPFVFGPQGQPITDFPKYDMGDGSHRFKRTGMTTDEYIAYYRDQVTYLNTLVLAAVDDVLANSPEPPIIIIQGDHGPGSHLYWESIEDTSLPERLSILNAYYFPDGDYSQLYPEITPVNSFRIVLSQYFGQDYPPLADHSYFSSWERPYAFSDVTPIVAPRD